MSLENKLTITILFALLCSCGSNHPHQLAHDGHNKKEGVWHIHTGRGIKVVEFLNPESGEPERVESGCDLDGSDPQCREMIHAFLYTDILRFAGLAKKVAQAELRAETAGAMLSGSIAAYAGKVAAGGLAAPEPAVTKVTAVASGVVSGLAGAMFFWQSKTLLEIYDLLDRIDHELALEARYADRCGHMSRDFMARMAALGVEIWYPDLSPMSIPGSEYLEAAAYERKLFKETLGYAVQDNLTAGEAYERYFRPRCGQMASTSQTSFDKLFYPGWAQIPAAIHQVTMAAGELIGLRYGGGISLSGFGEEDLRSEAQVLSIVKFLYFLKHIVQGYQHSKSAFERRQIAAFRKDIDEIIIRPRYGHTTGPSYQVKKIGAKKVLFLNAKWYVFKDGYRLRSGDFFRDEYGLTRLSGGR